MCAASIAAFFKGKTATFESVVKTTTIHWKQGSMLGFGGDRSQTYRECYYQLDGNTVVVFVQSDWDLPKPMKIDGKVQVR